MLFLNSIPISSTKVRNGVFAYKYRSGSIVIEGKTYMFYSMKDSIKLWRKENPLN